MKEYTVRVTTTHTVNVIADSSEEARKEGIDVVSQMVVKEDEITAKCLGWVIIDED